MIARREHHKLFLTVMTIFILAAVVGVGFICWNNYVNNGRCEHAHGSGATWGGRDICLVPVTTGGLS